MSGKVYLIPSEMGEQRHELLFPEMNRTIISSVDWYIVENIRTARRFIKKVYPEKAKEFEVVGLSNQSHDSEIVLFDSVDGEVEFYIEE